MNELELVGRTTLSSFCCPMINTGLESFSYLLENKQCDDDLKIKGKSFNRSYQNWVITKTLGEQMH